MGKSIPAGRVSITLAEDWTSADGETFDAGDSIETSRKLAGRLIADGIADVAPTSREEIIAAATKAAEEAVKGDPKNRNRKGVAIMVDGYEEKGEFMCFAHFLRDVARVGLGSDISTELKHWASQTKDMNTEVESQGGFLVPGEFASTLYQTRLEQSVVRPRAQIIPMSTNRIVVPALVDDSHASTIRGVTVTRGAENDSISATTLTTRGIALTLTSIKALTHVSQELLEDSPISMGPLVTKALGEALAFTADQDHLTGSGAGRPLGVLKSPALVTHARATDSEVNAADIAAMWSRLHPASMANAVWVCSPAVFPQLAALQVGTAGPPIWLNSLREGAPGSIYGRPLIISEKVPTLNTEGDIGVYDFGQYLIGEKVGSTFGVSISSSIHLNFDKDQHSFRAVLRDDGQGWWSSPLTPANSGATLSPFVALTDD